MNLKAQIKPAWKAAMRSALKVYTSNYSLQVESYPFHHGNSKASYPRSSDPDLSFHGEFGQDSYVTEVIFKGKMNGTYVDVGANHPTECSNTYLLEQLGWSGLAIEPQPSMNRLWKGVRNVPCLDCVVGAETKEVVFVDATPEEHGLSGVDGYNNVRVEHSRRNIQQRRLDEILLEHGMTDVDYLSIDVEGYEMSVLAGIDFSKINIRLIGLENNTGFSYLPLIGKKIGFELGNNAVRRFLRDKGYRHIARLVIDDFFIKD